MKRIDNTFSRNTPKMLTYSVALGRQEDVQPVSKEGEVSGWLLKKKRKRMQGWAKRWFSLLPSGVLSYSTSQGSVTRGSIQILVATISYNAKMRQIHIDSGTMIYHLKTLTEEDYDKWCSALKDIRTNIDDDSPIQEEYNKSNVSLSGGGGGMNKRISSRGYGGVQSDNKKMRAEIDHGIESCAIQQQNIDYLLNSINELVALLPANGNTQLFNKLEQQKLQVLSGVQEQISQWQNVQNCLNSPRRSGSNSPVSFQQQDGTIPEYEPVHRASSVYSHVSGYSDQFFDAEDIHISGGEEDFEDDDNDRDSSIDDEESSDGESGNFYLKKKKPHFAKLKKPENRCAGFGFNKRLQASYKVTVSMPSGYPIQFLCHVKKCW